MKLVQQTPLIEQAQLRLGWLTAFTAALVNYWVAIGIILLVAWALLWLVFRIATGLIHLVVILALIAIVWGLVRRAARAIDRKL